MKFSVLIYRLVLTNDYTGTYEVLVGHGKVFDSDTFHDVEGCHGKLNRLMCINNEVVTKNCHWNRNPDGVSRKL